MISILLDAVLPVFIMAGVGLLIGRTLKPDPVPVSRLALYVFSPALIFSSLVSAQIPFRDILSIFSFLVTWLPVLFAISWLIAWRAGFKAQSRSAFLLSTLFMNAVNYGLPVSLFAFGEEGLQRALLFLAPQALLSATLAVFVASSGAQGGMKSLLAVFRMPMFYATVGALALNALNVAVPSIVDKPLKILGGAAIPAMIMTLGIQLANVTVKEGWLPAGTATFVRLLVSPALALGVTLLLGINGVTQKVVIVLAGMPTAVYTTILATEFKTQPYQVTNAVALSTGASLVTITSLIWLVDRFL